MRAIRCSVWLSASANVLPIDDRRVERFVPASAGRPDLLGDRKSLTVYPGMTGLGEINVSNDYKQGDNAFTGKINRVTVEVK